MAEITELTELTTVADDDELVIYDVSVGTGNSKKISLILRVPLEIVYLSSRGKACCARTPKSCCRFHMAREDSRYKLLMATPRLLWTKN